MSTLLKIEQSLKALDQAAFQKLCAAYLSYEYEDYEVKEIGGSHGQNTTTTGTPDILIDCKNGKYIFAECTIQKKSITKKFLGDIANCFDTEKTGIAVQDIQLIILCHNTKTLTPKQKRTLTQAAQKHSCDIQFIDIDNLKFDLYKKYSKLAKDFLGIDVDTQQILSVSNFIKEQERKATTLKNKFLGRQQELKDIKNLLNENSIVILTGSAGVGKTRLAIEAFKQFKEENTSYEVLGIDNKGMSIWNDLQTYFLPGHKYLLIVDDANRITEFQHIARLSTTNNFDIKLIVTVRDYALEKIHKTLQDYKFAYEEYEVQKLTDDTTKGILNSLNITNPLCIDNITRIADGNPRLVLMSAGFVLKDDDCRKLANIVDIYDEYFSKVLSELNDLSDERVLKTLGIICFFRNINKDKIEINQPLFSAFDIDENDFWESIYKLNNIEIVDLYEKEIVKISDQTIATYFFYYVFIKKQILDYSTILEEFLDSYSGKVKENFYPILEYFDYESVMKVLDKAIDKKLNGLRNDEKSLMNFFDIFWFCRKEKLLIWLHDKIDQLEPDRNTEYNFLESHSNSYYEEDQYLRLLKLFGHHSDEFFSISLNILFEYIQKKPAILPKVITYFKEDLSFRASSYNEDYIIQATLFNFLFNRAKDGINQDLIKRIIFSISSHFLGFEFRSIEGGRVKSSISISTILIGADKQVLELRKRIFIFLLEEFKNYPLETTSVIKDYISSTIYQALRYKNREGIQKVYREDQTFLVAFIEKNLDRESYIHCKLVHDYFNLLKRNKQDISAYNNLLQRFTNEIYEISMILNWDFNKKKEEDEKVTKHNFEEIKKQEIIAAFENYQFENYINLIGIIEKLLIQEPQINFGWYQGLESFEIVLVDLVNRDLKLCLKVLENLLSSGNRINFVSAKLVQEIMALLKDEPKQFYELLFNHNYSQQIRWKLSYFEYLPQNKIDANIVDELLATYGGLESNTYLRFGFLEKYKVVRKDIFVQVIETLLTQSKKPNFKIHYHHYTFFEEHLKEFSSNIELLKKFYFFTQSVDDSFDYEGKILKLIYQLDSDFIYEYLEQKFGQNPWITARHNYIKFDFIWHLSNYEQVLENVLNYFIGDKFFSLSEHPINDFFPKDSYIDKVDEFIKKYIQINSGNNEKIKAIFNVITYTYPQKMDQATFLGNN